MSNGAGFCNGLARGAPRPPFAQASNAQRTRGQFQQSLAQSLRAMLKLTDSVPFSELVRNVPLSWPSTEVQIGADSDECAGVERVWMFMSRVSARDIDA